MTGRGKPDPQQAGVAGKKLNIPSTGSSGVAPRYSRPGSVNRPPVATEKASGKHSPYPVSIAGGEYSIESLTTSTVSSIHCLAPPISLPLPKAMMEPPPRCNKPGLLP